MKESFKNEIAGSRSSQNLLMKAGIFILRYGLVLTLLYFGTLKFTDTEAQGIKGLLENSPLMSWMIGVFGLQGASNIIGITEIVTAILIALRPFAPKLSAYGSLLGVATFLATLSFLITTPGNWGPYDWYPIPGPTGAAGFLLKDIFLLGASLLTAGEAFSAVRPTVRENLPSERV